MRLSTTLSLLALLTACGGGPKASTTSTTTQPAPTQTGPSQSNPVATAPTGPACISSDDCSDTLPVCDSVAHVCVPCNGNWNTNATHACAIGSQKCEPDGSCGQCTQASDCAPMNMACTGSTCGSCTDDAQCDTGRCLPGGTCAPTSSVRLVDNTGACGDASSADGINVPYCNPGDGIPASGQVVLKVAASKTPYDSFSISHLYAGPALDVAIVGASASGVILGNGDGNVVNVTTLGGAPVTLTLRNVDIAPANHMQGFGIGCAGSASTILMADSIIEGVTGGGISSSQCDVTVTRSIIRQNLGPGINASYGSLGVVSSVIANNTQGGVQVSQLIGRLDHVTIVDNTASAGSAGVSCYAESAFHIVDSIVAFNGLPLTGGLDVSGTNNLDTHCPTQAVATGIRGNVSLACSPIFVDSAHGDFHIDQSPANLEANQGCVIAQGTSNDWTDLDGTFIDVMDSTSQMADLGAYATK